LKYKVKELQRAIIGLEELSGKRRKTQAEILKEKIVAQISTVETKPESKQIQKSVPESIKKIPWWKKLFSKN
jgi:primosomal protein N''